VLVYDGSGSARPVASKRTGDLGDLECETFSWFEFKDGKLERIAGTTGRQAVEWLGLLDGITNSIGNLYELISSMIGFGRREVGKTMGLAGWGSPRYLDALAPYMQVGDSMDAVFTSDTLDPGFQATIEDLLSTGGDSFQARADMAATVQEVLTQCLIRCYDLVADRDFDVFGIAGGCALNTVANGILAKRLPPGRSLCVPPHAGDSGTAMGSLWLYRAEAEVTPFTLTLRGAPAMPAAARPGKLYDRRSTKDAIGVALPHAAENHSITGPRELAAELAKGKIIGIFNGASETGPRALGGRSIFADPRRAQIKERLNREIKLREPFRPLAPILLAEQYDSLFSPPAAANPFMLVVADANADCRRRAPAVIHVDGTARVQVLQPEDDPFLVDLLREFAGLTGLAMLLNTSFNRRGEPIVETPAEAVDAFLAMGLDGLWLAGTYLEPVPDGHAQGSTLSSRDFE
jgi:carbamoyltransferase